ncbi:MAG: methyl-accepting chemotaxis protein [Proteobacteria bacterium]|uniref:Methyl-accepting chemotaxis protein n=1 Tax=Candidatus Avisuccinivibrio stercorigallinarum TaxID=2840704 RepID=A0A9D9DC34_9GAMM|nr:methyl-accepting chemotaxis protein [Candidatus Avisuccinivibrio stercorigallinarum]
MSESMAGQAAPAAAKNKKSGGLGRALKGLRIFRLSIQQRVTFSQLLYIVLFAVAAVLIFLANHNQQDRLESIGVDGVYQVGSYAARIDSQLMQAGAEMIKISEGRSSNKSIPALTAIKDVYAALQTQLELLPPSPVKEELDAAFRDYLKPGIEEFDALARALSDGRQVQGDDIVRASEKIYHGTGLLNQGSSDSIYRAATGATELLRWGTLAVLIGLGVMIACFVLTYVSLRRSLHTNTDLLLQALRRVEQGDLTVRVDLDAGDEIGVISRLANSFVESSDKTLGLIQEDIERLHGMVGTNRTAVDNTNEAILDQRNKAQYVTNATAEMEQAVEKVAEFAKSTLDEVKNAEQASETCRMTMSDNITTTHTLSDRLRASSNAINRIHDMGDKIKSIVKTIDDIADQTNLLALNATIEAARAGDAGRGFAIVAEEIRNLASKTALSTKEVGTTIGELDDAVINSVKVMASCEGEMNNSLSQSSKANSSIEEIMGIIATISDMSEQIVSSCEQQAASAGEINRSIANISKLTEDSYEQMSGIHASMSELDELASSQAQVLQRFTLSRRQA